MKTARRAGALALALVGSTALWAAPGPAGGLAGTAHDFSANVVRTGRPNAASTCVFCHTPRTAPGAQPLWNRTLSRAQFSYGERVTSAGTPYAVFSGDNYKGPSTKCLGCHDGTVALGEAGSRLGTVAPAELTARSALGATRLVGSGGNMAGNHPVAMPYPYGGIANTYNGIRNGARLPMADYVADPTVNNIRLYSEDAAGDIVGKPKAGSTGVECSSCHDPHNKASRDVFFLRGKRSGATQASGYLCLQCHIRT